MIWIYADIDKLYCIYYFCFNIFYLIRECSDGLQLCVNQMFKSKNIKLINFLKHQTNTELKHSHT